MDLNKHPEDIDVCAQCGWFRVHHSGKGACIITDGNGCFARYHDTNTFKDAPMNTAHPKNSSQE